MSDQAGFGLGGFVLGVALGLVAGSFLPLNQWRLSMRVRLSRLSTAVHAQLHRFSAAVKGAQHFGTFTIVWLILLTGLVAYGIRLGYIGIQNDAERALESGLRNKENAVTGCENANESREANRALWSFVFDLSEASNPDATAAERERLNKIRGWVNRIYAERDCTDLTKKYPLPPPPSIELLTPQTNP